MNCKIACLTLSFLSCLSPLMQHAAAGEATWLAKFDHTLTVEDARRISTDGKMPDGSVPFVLGKDTDYVNLARLCGKYRPEKDAAVLFCIIESEKTEMRTLGIGCDWWFTCYVNGVKAGTTEPDGNYAFPITPYNHGCRVQLKKGLNFVAIHVRPGSTSWGFAFRILPEMDEWPATAAAREALFNMAFPDKKIQAILGGPTVFRVTPNSAEITVLFQLPATAGIRFRKSGSSGEDNEIWSLLGGQRDKKERHTLKLENLLPDTDYSFELITLNEDKAEFETLRTGSFRTFPVHGLSHTFYAVSDLQIGAEARIRALKSFLNNCHMRDSRFFVSLGDVDSVFDSFHKVYFDSFLNILDQEKFKPPFVPVRGNHEYRGDQSGDYLRTFGSPYYAFRYGDVFYIVIDTGEDKPTVLTPNHHTIRTMAESFMEEQAAWLKNIIQSDACKSAKKRIVLAHTVPFEWENRYYAANIQKFAHVFYGEHPECKIDLWLCADIHAAYRFDPETRELHGAFRRCGTRSMRMTDNDLKDIRFPVYVNDGPGASGWEVTVSRIDVTDDAIEIACYTREGHVVDHIRIRPGKPFEVVSTVFRPYEQMIREQKK